MAKKSLIEREKKRRKLVTKFLKSRLELKEKITQVESLDEKIFLQSQLQKYPRNSSKVRLHNRCWLTGRPKGFYRDFGLSRHVFRELANEGLLPGVTRSSW
uniref:Small ribosomal subunit protein uS14c n=1 Tax=Gloeochaete wittrockiana TaxID=38269 RepID=A0A3G1IW44_9EUKA|nr:ribosomal protein S14 [Gloeochaete wittrockiana]ASQ40265.1 ribosomal protein S14 [Gloeochaete wittrockiana]